MTVIVRTSSGTAGRKTDPPPRGKHKHQRHVKVRVPVLALVRAPRDDFAVGNLLLQGKQMSARLQRSITAGSVETTIQGASTLTITVSDWDRTLLTSELLMGAPKAPPTLVFDGIEFCLVKTSTAEDDTVSLTFEEYAVHLLRLYSSPKKANRATTTRAQFVRSLVREVTQARIPFRCPEVNVTEPIAGVSTSALSVAADVGVGQHVGGITVKHVAATPFQVQNIRTLLTIAKQMGANHSQMAGALATMTQESGCVNLSGGDRDSVGLFQQRPSCGWGTVAQCTNPDYACRAFLKPYLAYCRQGNSPIAASNLVQRSAFPQAPAQWYSEAWDTVTAFMGSKDFADATSSGTSRLVSTSQTRNKPYEFSRGNSGKRETSWDCIGRLAQEVSWDRFMRAGALWFVSENWLMKQPPRFVVEQGARGVLSITQSSDERRRVAEMTVTALAKRWSVLPGEVVAVKGQGAGDGAWLVSDTRRDLTDDTTAITLKRETKQGLEPAPQTETITNTKRVGGVIAGGTVKGPAKAQAFYDACQQISDKHYPYVWGGGHAQAGRPSGGGYDCSGSVSAACAMCSLGLTMGGLPKVASDFESWGVPGEGRYFTIMASSDHVWVRFNHIGRAWRFDTSPHGCGPDGPAMRYCPRFTSGFVARHWPGM